MVSGFNEFVQQQLNQITDPNIKNLAQQLLSRNPSQIIQAAKELATHYLPTENMSSLTPVLPLLYSLLRDKNTEVKRAAIWALGELRVEGPPMADLSTFMNPKQDPRVRATAAEALGKIQSLDSAYLLSHVLETDQDPNVKLLAGRALGEIGDPRALPVLMDTLKSKDVSLRAMGIEALGKIGDVASRDALIDRLRNDSEPGIRAEAALALGKLKDPKPEGTRKALMDALKNDKHENPRATAAWVLGSNGFKEANSVLIKALEDSSSLVRKHAAAALQALKIATPEVINRLNRVFHDDPVDQVRGEALRAYVELSKIHPAGRSFLGLELKQAESDRSLRVVLIAKEELRRLGEFSTPIPTRSR